MCRYLLLLVNVFLIFLSCTGISAETDEKKVLPKENMISGWKMFRLGEYNQALKFFQKAQETSEKKSPDYFQALFGMAKTYQLQSPTPDRNESTRIFRQIISESPDSDLAGWSMLALARQAHLPEGEESPNYESVGKAYQELIDKFPRHPAADEAFVYQQSTHLVSLDKKDASDALANIEKFLASHPQTHFAGTAWSLVAECNSIIGDSDKKLDALIKALGKMEIDPTNPVVENSSTYWKIATVAEFEAGDFDTARKYYMKLKKEYPSDARCYGAKLAIERMDKKEAELLNEIKAGR